MWSARVRAGLLRPPAGIPAALAMAAAVGLAFASARRRAGSFDLVSSRWEAFRENVLMRPAELDSPKRPSRRPAPNLSTRRPADAARLRAGTRPARAARLRATVSAWQDRRCGAAAGFPRRARTRRRAAAGRAVTTSRPGRTRAALLVVRRGRARCCCGLWWLAFRWPGVRAAACQRYLQPAFCCCGSRLRLRAAAPSAGPLAFVALVSCCVLRRRWRRPGRRAVGGRERQAAEVQALSAQIKAWKATYLVGDYWDIAPFRYWSFGSHHLDRHRSALNPSFPACRRRDRVGILVATMRLPTGAAMAARCDLARSIGSTPIPPSGLSGCRPTSIIRRSSHG